MTESPRSRVAFLRDRVEAATTAREYTTFAVPFRQHQIDLVRIEVPIGFPLYNLQSGRTHRAQAEWIERNQLSAEFFADPEDEEAQAAQHQILADLVDQEGLAANLADKQQRNPVVLTYDGVIIDGNRRAAALREQAEVENLTAVVMPPDASASEVYETELELQMALQTKADYNWVDEALHVAYGIRNLYQQAAGVDARQAIRAIAARMNRSDRDVEEILGRLNLVDLYLEWLAEPGKYHRLSTDGRTEAAQAFTELYQRENRQAFRALPELQRRAIRNACFAVIRREGGYMDIRRVADALRERPTQLVERVRDELPEDLSTKLDEPVVEPVIGDGAPNELLAELAGAEDDAGTPPGAQLLNVVADSDDGHQAAPAIMQVAQDLAEEQRDTQRHLEPKRQVERALRLLQGVQLTDETQQLGDVARALEQIMGEADRLGEAVERLRGDGD